MSTISLTDVDVRVRERRRHAYWFGDDAGSSARRRVHVFMGSVAERVLRKGAVSGLDRAGTEAVERDIIVLLAGAQAERICVGRSSCPAGGLDFHEAMRRAESTCRTIEEMSAYLRWLRLWTRALVESPTGVGRSK